MTTTKKDIALINKINQFAEKEGWAIFNGCEIQRDDELKFFVNDDAAIAHVRTLADRGSYLHATALTYHNAS